jgi:hypothetical protein
VGGAPPTIDGELAELTVSDTPALLGPPLEPEPPELDDMPELEPEPSELADMPELEPLDPPPSLLRVLLSSPEHANSALAERRPADHAAYLFMRLPMRVSPLRCTAGKTYPRQYKRYRDRRAPSST